MNKLLKENSKIFIWVTLFSIAMGYLETSVVVYLRLLYFPEGFGFPLKILPTDVAMVEFWREAATILMLIGIGIVSGKNSVQRFAYFIYSFAIWDIFYYVFLYVTLGWPSSLMTWDVLFLIPVPWVGPVWSPVVIAMLMIVLAYFMILFNQEEKNAPLKRTDWILFISGSLMVILSWTIDYCSFLIEHNPDQSIWTLSGDALFEMGVAYVPTTFYWELFTVGALMILAGIIQYYRRNR
ncbi:MAG: hypothetical protein IH948_01210 [Bacteroidetes bacterium]|nr:hypothetical protein [Bacteroidota bacterium]